MHGVVKYVGPLDSSAREKRVFVGLKVEEGDTDGSHNGVRYFSVPHSKGRFLRASLVQSVLCLRVSEEGAGSFFTFLSCASTFEDTVSKALRKVRGRIVK